MIFNSPKLNLLQGGWYVVFKDGSVITEEDMSWVEVPRKKDIQIMGLKRHNKYYEIEGKETYTAPGETHFREIIVNPGTGYAVTKQDLISWNIGYYAPEGKVIMRVSATDKSVTTEVVPYNKKE
jgi:hypothetical protein